jgi:hypothetical protein
MKLEATSIFHHFGVFATLHNKLGVANLTVICFASADITGQLYSTDFFFRET